MITQKMNVIIYPTMYLCYLTEKKVCWYELKTDQILFQGKFYFIV